MREKTRQSILAAHGWARKYRKSNAAAELLRPYVPIAVMEAGCPWNASAKEAQQFGARNIRAQSDPAGQVHTVADWPQSYWPD